VSSLDYAQAVVLGIVQGLTEFLPVSSSAHLAITQHHFALKPDGAVMLLFDVFAHLGTLIAVGLVFAKPIKRFAVRFVAESSASWQRPRYAWRIAMLAVAASVPTAFIGLNFQKTFETAFSKPRWIGSGLILTGVLLALLAVVPRGRLGWQRFTWWHAVMVGVAQGFAVFPGISRSGATICFASYLGLRRRWAAEFSFLIAAPAILGGTLLKLRDTLQLPSEQLREIPLGPVAVGSLVSFVVGVGALVMLLGAVRRAKLHYFSAYCLALGVWMVFSRSV